MLLIENLKVLKVITHTALDEFLSMGASLRQLEGRGRKLDGKYDYRNVRQLVS